MKLIRNEIVNIIDNYRQEFDEDIPYGVKFNNSGHVILNYVRNISNGLEFNNSGHVYINNINNITNDIKFNNTGDIHLMSLYSLPYDLVFNNTGFIFLYKRIKLEHLSYNEISSIYSRLPNYKCNFLMKQELYPFYLKLLRDKKLNLINE